MKFADVPAGGRFKHCGLTYMKITPVWVGTGLLQPPANAIREGLFLGKFRRTTWSFFHGSIEVEEVDEQ